MFSSNRKGVENLWRIAARGGTPERAALSGPQGKYPIVSRQGSPLAYTAQYSDFNIWQYSGSGFGNGAGAASAPLDSPEPLITSSRED
ncbi:MAG: hypothetical protein M3Y07_16380 [Acidobacteriota bacterium]|nr:hypothetical protein [Acidobacteriota bacterium]